ncbi:MAG TPA: hypothetical protein VGW78_06415 [Candidatus Babeliales bacterium]|jgi:hypothetical protein|nr:hypothetical protein [Candidatus Babeliales bacterium]
MKKLRVWCINFMLMHLFLTLISLPILIGWGLPLSLVSPLGNLIFSPFLSVYLVCTVLLFFTELISVPNTLIVSALEAISHAWLWCMSLLTDAIHIGFAKPHPLFLLLIPLMACITVWYFRMRLHRCIMALSILLVSVCGILCTIPTHVQEFTVARGADTIQCIVADNHVAIIDQQGVLSHCATADQWVLHHLIPAITQKTGHMHIDYCMLMHPRKRSFDAIAALSTVITIQHIYLPRWTGMLSKSAWHAYKHMCACIEAKGGSITEYEVPFFINLGEKAILSYIPSGKTGRYHDAVYPIFVPDLLNKC